MGIVDRRGKVIKLEELIITSLAQADALSKLLIEQGLITEVEYMDHLSEERATYQVMMEKVRQPSKLRRTPLKRRLIASWDD